MFVSFALFQRDAEIRGNYKRGEHDTKGQRFEDGNNQLLSRVGHNSFKNGRRIQTADKYLA
jgi:hypothetical protein